MQNISYQFNFSRETDEVKFTLKLGAQIVSITLGTDSFIELCGKIAVSNKAFFEIVNKKRAEGTEGDVEFDTESWDKLMNTTEG